MSRNGIDWFPMETGAFIDDEKIDALLYDGDVEQGYADFARYMKIACRIYREGPALQLDRQWQRKLMRDLDLDGKGFADLLERLMGVGLLDRELWEGEHVLTSKGIQRRWLTAKKRKALPPDMEQWSLLDRKRGNLGESAPLSEDGISTQDDEPSENTNLGKRAPLSEIGISGRIDEPREIPISENEKNRSPRRRVEEEIDKEREERREEVSQSLDERAKGTERCPGCLMQPHPKKGMAFLDQSDGPHRTAYGALEVRYATKTGRGDFAQVMAKAAQTCPGGCRASPEDACACFKLMAKAIDAFDPTKGASPWPLMRKILTEDRGSDG